MVLVIVIALVLVVVTKSPAKQNTTTTLVSTSLLSQVTGVPASVYTKVGLPSELSNYPKKVGKGYTALTSGGLPVMLYEGAEYCPFCAAERWAMVMALSKFGTFSNLHTTYSSVSDFAPDTATFTFYNATYKSQYLVFQPYELATNQSAASSNACNVNGYACLQTPPTSASNLLTKLGGGSFPFMDFGNKVMQSGAGFGDQPLALSGLSYTEIAQQLSDASTPVAQAEDGSANYITAAICSMTHNQPGDVCSAPYIKTAQTKAGL
ncbi:MAG: DUF929 family protein [Acidimicrobiales bacterium]